MIEDEKFARQHLAHALLSPLTVVLGSLEMLLNQGIAWPGYAVEILELAMAQAQRLHDTLDELLATAQVQDNAVLLSWPRPMPYPEPLQAQEEPAKSPETEYEASV